PERGGDVACREAERGGERLRRDRAEALEAAAEDLDERAVGGECVRGIVRNVSRVPHPGALRAPTLSRVAGEGWSLRLGLVPGARRGDRGVGNRRGEERLEMRQAVGGGPDRAR